MESNARTELNPEGQRRAQPLSSDQRCTHTATRGYEGSPTRPVTSGAPWNPKVYDNLDLPHLEWGRWAVDALALAGNERVLDAGCGTGRDLELVVNRYQGVRAIGLDADPGMLEAARSRLAEHSQRVTLAVADLTRPLPVAEAVDAALSVAVLHWVDQPAVLANLADVVRPGGRLAVDCGGAGNIALVRQAMTLAGLDHGRVARFATVEDMANQLDAAGFEVLICRLVETPARPADRTELARQLAELVLSRHLRGLDPATAEEILETVLNGLPHGAIDWVRLRAIAVKR